MWAETDDFVGLFYPNPDGTSCHCLNSKLARAELTVDASRAVPRSTCRHRGPRWRSARATLTTASGCTCYERSAHRRRTLAIVALLAVAVWLGGLVALGAVAAPVVFSTVPWPSSADAMSIVFRRFDAVAMACAAIVLATEAVRAVAG